MAATVIEQVVRLNLERYGPAAAKRRHIEIARAGLAAFLARQGDAAPAVELIVDGHAAASEEEVKPFGVIIYRFRRMRDVAMFALAEAVRLSPVRSGRYRDAWFAISNGAEIDLSALAQNTRDLWITNDVPYARKIHMRGARLLNVPPGIVERLRQTVLRKYGAIVEANIEFIHLEGAHVLSTNGQPSKFFPYKRKVYKRREVHGQAITYPALHISSKIG